MTEIIVIILLILFIAMVILQIISLNKIKKYKNMYDKALAKFDSADNPKGEFNNIYDRLNKLEEINEENKQKIEDILVEQKNKISKIELLKYNAIDEGASKLSFILALTDENNRGILINQIYSKYGSNMYLKEIKNGNVEGRISEEEKKVLNKLTGIEEKPWKK